MKRKHRCFPEIIYYRFLDKDLNLEEIQRLSSHLEGCKQCQTFIGEIRQENLEIGKLFTPPGPPPDLVSQVMKRLARIESLKSWRKWGLAYAAALLLIGFLFFFSLFHKPSSPSREERQVLIQSARVQGQTAQPHIFASKDPDVKFIWLEKI